MVDAGEIFAEIDASAGMVRFLEDPEQFTSPAAVDRLNTTIQACSVVAQKLQALNTQVSNTQSIGQCCISLGLVTTRNTMPLNTQAPQAGWLGILNCLLAMQICCRSASNGRHWMPAIALLDIVHYLCHGVEPVRHAG